MRTHSQQQQQPPTDCSVHIAVSSNEENGKDHTKDNDTMKNREGEGQLMSSHFRYSF